MNSGDQAQTPVENQAEHQTNTKQIVLECRDVYKTFKEAALDVEVLKGVNLQVAKEEQVAIMGASGSGKSTLLHLLGGLDSCSQGEILIQGENFSRMKEAPVGIVTLCFLVCNTNRANCQVVNAKERPLPGH